MAYEHKLTAKKCRECKKEILVAEYSPHPLESESTGMPADIWDSIRDNFVCIGWICNECAFGMALVKNGGGMVSGGGSGGFSFAYMPREGNGND